MIRLNKKYGSIVVFIAAFISFTIFGSIMYFFTAVSPTGTSLVIGFLLGMGGVVGVFETIKKITVFT